MKDLLAKCLQAIDIAESVMDYCGGDAWERECTADDRAAFSRLADEVRAAAEELGAVANVN
jgi:hypothetical protein